MVSLTKEIHRGCGFATLDIFPGSIPMQRVNWEAKSDYEYIQNYKLLQQAFAKNKVQRYVDVDKLIRAKYQGEYCLSALPTEIQPNVPVLTKQPTMHRQLGILSMAESFL